MIKHSLEFASAFGYSGGRLPAGARHRVRTTNICRCFGSYWWRTKHTFLICSNMPARNVVAEKRTRCLVHTKSKTPNLGKTPNHTDASIRVFHFCPGVVLTVNTKTMWIQVGSGHHTLSNLSLRDMIISLEYPPESEHKHIQYHYQTNGSRTSHGLMKQDGWRSVYKAIS